MRANTTRRTPFVHLVALVGVPTLLMAPEDADAVDRRAGRSFVTRSPAMARHGMAATSQPLATFITKAHSWGT